MNTQDLLTKPVAEIDFRQRLQLMAILLDDSPIKHVDLSEDLCVMALSGDEPTRPGATRSCKQRCYLSFRPTRLFILDQRQEFIELQITERSENPEPGSPWLTHIKETRQTRRIVDVPADVWSVSALYLGNRSVLTAGNDCRSVPGAAFVDGYKLNRDLVVPAGIDVCISASHSSKNDARFYALLFGIPVAS